VATSHAARTYPTRRDESSAAAEPHLDDNVGVASRRGADRKGGGQPRCRTVPSLLPLARHLGDGFLPVPRGGTLPRSPQPREAARILPTRCATDPTTASRPWNCRSGLTEQILASRDWLSPMKSAS
jgi:hypothetical protein